MSDRDSERAAVIKAIVDSAPPLTDEQRTQIARLLRGASKIRNVS